MSLFSLRVANRALTLVPPVTSLSKVEIRDIFSPTYRHGHLRFTAGFVGNSLLKLQLE
jgi:hypothetical protein